METDIPALDEIIRRLRTAARDLDDVERLLKDSRGQERAAREVADACDTVTRCARELQRLVDSSGS